jgi:uncharacterized membrane protein YedE/YeeE
MSVVPLSTAAVGAALLGGALIGAAASILLVINGRIAGISGILAGIFSRSREEITWRALFLGGLLTGGALFAVLRPDVLAADVHPAATTTALAGLLVGWGTRLSGGCTSGHGVCGISRLSGRSIIATGTFIVSGMLTVALVGHLWGAVR